MFSLVGKYLVVTGGGSRLTPSGEITYYGSWAIFKSRSGDGRDWSMIEADSTSEPMAREADAAAAVKAIAIGRARLLQGDALLEERPWTVSFPQVDKSD